MPRALGLRALVADGLGRSFAGWVVTRSERAACSKLAYGTAVASASREEDCRRLILAPASRNARLPVRGFRVGSVRSRRTRNAASQPAPCTDDAHRARSNASQRRSHSSDGWRRSLLPACGVGGTCSLCSAPSWCCFSSALRALRMRRTAHPLRTRLPLRHKRPQQPRPRPQHQQRHQPDPWRT